MLIARYILLKDDPQQWQEMLEPHDSSYLGTDAYYAFLVHNGLWPAIMRQRSATGYLAEAPALQNGVLEGRFPDEIRADLERLLDHYGQYPILVRSSSLQEDGFGNAFAGKYDSVFLVNQGSPEQRLAALEKCHPAGVCIVHEQRCAGIPQTARARPAGRTHGTADPAGKRPVPQPLLPAGCCRRGGVPQHLCLGQQHGPESRHGAAGNGTGHPGGGPY